MSRAFRLALLLPAVFACLLLAAGGNARAQGPSATATLSRSEVGVGDEVELTIKVRGASQMRWNGGLQVDGLEIRGPRMESALGFGGFGALGDGITMKFSVTPLREGKFTIPPFALSADGQTVRTPAVELTVKAGLKQQPQQQGDAAAGTLEIVLPKKSVYVGETVPVEIRLLVDSVVRWQPEAMPEITGEGFTKQKLPEPKQEQGTRNGRQMDVLVFRTTITPSRPGQITLGPIEVPYIAQIPRAKRNRRSGSIFDLFDDSVFGDPFFAENRRFKARAEPVQIDVKPLPAEGKPKSFSGAIGRFKFDASGSPSEVKMGDPVTMTLSVTGRGNFDRITEPRLVSSAGWRTYPPSANFKADDDLNLTGTKTFTMAVIPEKAQKQMPAFEFSYFDPETAKYVVLQSKPAALTVSGAPAPAPEPVAPVATPETPKPAAAREPAAPADTHGIRYDVGSTRRSFRPLYRQPAFLLGQLVPLVALCVLLARRLYRPDERGRALAQCRKEKAAAFARLQSGKLADADFLQAAAQAVQLSTAEVTGRQAGSIDAPTALASRRLDAETAATIERIFTARAELLYTGRGGGSETLTAEARREMASAVQRFDKSHA